MTALPQESLRRLVGTTQVNTPTARLNTPVNVKWYGAKGDGVTDDTAAIQACLDAEYFIYFPGGTYAVTQIRFRLAGSVVKLDNAIILGIATVATKSVVDLKAGSSAIWGLKVASNQNANYECGVHYYTNNTNLYGPANLQVYGLRVTSFTIGMVIGALPSQANPIPAAGTVQAENVATDATLSECFIHGFFTSNCVKALSMRQPNGKVTMISPNIIGEAIQWGGVHLANCLALEISNQGSELAVIGGYIEQNSSNTGAFIQVTAGTLKCFGTTIESQAPSYLAGEGRMDFIGCLDFGFNNITFNPFNVHATAIGRLLFADSQIVMPAGFYSTGGRSFVKAVADLNYTFSPNLSFIVEFRNCELRDFALNGSTTYTPLVQGLRARFAECHLSSWPAPGTARTVSKRLRQHTDLFAGLFDQSMSVLLAYPQTTTGTATGGFTFTRNSAADQWGAYATGLPTVEGEGVNRCLRMLAAGGGGYVQAVSGIKAITPGVPLLLTGFIKTGATGAGPVIVRIRYYKYDDTAASTAEQNVIAAIYESLVGTDWQNICHVASPPADACKFDLFLYSQNGSDVQLANLSMWQ